MMAPPKPAHSCLKAGVARVPVCEAVESLLESKSSCVQCLGAKSLGAPDGFQISAKVRV